MWVCLRHCAFHITMKSSISFLTSTTRLRSLKSPFLLFALKPGSRSHGFHAALAPTAATTTKHISATCRLLGKQFRIGVDWDVALDKTSVAQRGPPQLSRRRADSASRTRCCRPRDSIAQAQLGLERCTAEPLGADSPCVEGRVCVSSDAIPSRF